VPAVRFPEVAEALTGLEFFVPGTDDEDRPVAWRFGSLAEDLEEHHQTWVREPATGAWRLDVFREPSDGNTWICRRDARIRLRYDEVIDRTPDDVPYVRPEIALLFKAKHAHRPKDESDFAAVVPLLAPDRRRWLEEALALVHPGHPWLARLD
jgi:hypothetical protein